MLKQYCGWVTLSASVLLGACGGGGGDEPIAVAGDEPVTASVALSAANYKDISLVVVLSVLGGQSVDNFVALSASEVESQGTTAFGALGSGKVDAIARFALDRVAVRQTSKVKSAAVGTVSDPCDIGGTLLVSNVDADGSGDSSAGDTLTLQADNCVMVSGQPAVNGVLTIYIQALNRNVASATLNLTFTNFSSAGLMLDGKATFSSDTTRETLDYNLLKGTYKDQTLTHNFTVVRQLNTSPNTLTVSGNIVRNGSSYALSTPAIFQMGSYYPTAGVMQIADGRGGRIDVVTGSDGFVSKLYLPGDGVLPTDAFSYLWKDL